MIIKNLPLLNDLTDEDYDGWIHLAELLNSAPAPVPAPAPAPAPALASGWLRWLYIHMVGRLFGCR